MSVNTSESYIEIGTGYDSEFNLTNSLVLPVQHEAPFATEYFADAGRNSVGTMLLQQIGRDQYRSRIAWAKMKNTTYWKMNRWFEMFGYVFYAKYFNHTTGKVQIKRFYKGSPGEATPSTTQEIINGVSVPKTYHNVELSLIDMGEDDVITLSEVY